MARRILYTSKKKEEKKSPLEINETLVKGAAWSNYMTGGESSLDDGDWNVNAFDRAFNSAYQNVVGRLNQKDASKNPQASGGGGGGGAGNTYNYYGNVDNSTINETNIDKSRVKNVNKNIDKSRKNIEEGDNIVYEGDNINQDIDNSQTNVDNRQDNRDYSQTDNRQDNRDYSQTNTIGGDGIIGDDNTMQGDVNTTTSGDTTGDITNVNQVDPTQTDVNQVDPNKVDPNKVDPNEVDPNEVDPNEVDPNQVDPNQVDPNQVDPNQTNTNQTNTEQDVTNTDQTNTQGGDNVNITETTNEDPSDTNITQRNQINKNTTDVDNTKTSTEYSAPTVNPDYPEVKYKGPEVKFGEGTLADGKPIPSVDEILPTRPDGTPGSFEMQRAGEDQHGNPVYELTYKTDPSKFGKIFGKKSGTKTIRITEQQYNESIAPHVKSTFGGYHGKVRTFYRNDVSSPDELRYARGNKDMHNRQSSAAGKKGRKRVFSGYIGSYMRKKGPDGEYTHRYSNYNFSNPGGYDGTYDSKPSSNKYIPSAKESALQYRLARKSKLNPSPFEYRESPLKQLQEQPIEGGTLPEVTVTGQAPPQQEPLKATIWDAMNVITPDKMKKMTDEYINNLSLFGDEKSVETLGSDAKMEIGRYMNAEKERINQVLASGDPNSRNIVEQSMMNLKKIASKFNVIAENKAQWIEGKTDGTFSKGSKIDNMFMADLVYSESPAVSMAIMGGDSPEIFFKLDGVDQVYGSANLTDDVFQTDLESMALYGNAVNQLRLSAQAGENYSEGNVDALVSQMAKNKQAQLSFMWDGQDHIGIDIAGHLAEMYGSQTVSALHPNHEEFSEAYLEDVTKIALKAYLKREFDNAKPKPELSAEELLAKYSTKTTDSFTKRNFGMTSDELIKKHS